MANDTNNPTLRNNTWKYEAKIAALKSYVQCELLNLHDKIDRFMETFNKTISNFESKPYEILQDNIESPQNELRSKDAIIKTLMETLTAVLENLPLNKPPQQIESNTSFHDSPQKDVNQPNKNIIFKRQANQEYNNNQTNHNQKSKQEKRLYMGNLNKDVKEQDLIELFGFNATAYLQENCRVDIPIGKNGKNKGFGFAVMLKHVQIELLKLHETEFHGNIIITEEATSTRIKRPDEQKTGQNRLIESPTQGSTTEVVNDSSEKTDFIRANTVPGNKSYADVAMSRKTKNGMTKKVIAFRDSIIRGIRVRDFNQQVKNGYAKFKPFPGCNS